ncbi:hypothetical protein I6H07_06315 [Hafnia alvei]|uniref:hypothetical protein n=1 Tax=Hafnia alvei TaxID=569 RepID=UPI000C9F98A1|nr:hypothetical protein [Hafnia alvei]MBI0275448.1 hypothetical protein [Hafnia alvei]PNK98558.1 hypothetical protein CEQ28_013675 [Hafnia alvei]
MTTCTALSDSGQTNVWQYSDFHAWKDTILHLMGDVITPDVIDAFLQSNLDEMSPEDFSWLNTLVHTATGKIIDVPTILNQRLRDFYQSMRAYHGTKTNDIDSFYANGLLTLSLDDMKNRAIDIFLSGGYPELTPPISSLLLAKLTLWLILDLV